jgi:hypothetical protein
MVRANDGEVASIQCGDCTDFQSLGEGHDRCVDSAERKVVVSPHELRDSYPVGGKHRHRQEISGSEISEESHLGPPAQARFDEIGDFGDDELRHQQWTRMGFQKLQTLLMGVVIFVDVRVQRSGIDD